jgi:hypothetical protein
MKIIHLILWLLTLLAVTETNLLAHNTRQDIVSITVTINTTPVSCYGGNNGTATVTVSGGTSYTYRWSNGQTTQKATNLTMGSYTVTVTSGSQTIIAATKVSQPTPLLGIITPPAMINCTSPTTKITASSSGGTAPYTYRWSTNATSNVLTVAQANNYILTITDSKGCKTTATTTVTQAAPLEGSISMQSPISCTSLNTTLIANVNGGTTPYTYLWSTNTGTREMVINTEGVYSVTITDNKKCKTVVSTTISCLPTLILNHPTNITVTAPANATTIPIDYKTPTATSTCTTGKVTVTKKSGLASGSAFPLGTNTVCYQATDGCGNTKTGCFNVIVNAPVSTLTVTTSVTNMACFGENNGSIKAIVTGGGNTYTYRWSDGQTTQTAMNLNKGTYKVTVTSGNQTATAAAAVTEPSQLVGSILPPTPITCAIPKSILTAGVQGGTAPYAYNWSTNAANNSTSIAISGNYEVTITDNNGCMSIANATVTGSCTVVNAVCDSIQIMHNAKGISISNLSQASNIRTVVVVTNANNNQIVFICVNNCSIQKGVLTIPNLGIEAYNIKVDMYQIINGRQMFLCQKVEKIVMPPLAFALKSAHKSTHKVVDLYPNPALDIVNIDISAFYSQKVTINIFNKLGQMVKTQVLQEAVERQITIDLDDLREGLYTVSLISNGEQITNKLVVSKSR